MKRISAVGIAGIIPMVVCGLLAQPAPRRDAVGQHPAYAVQGPLAEPRIFAEGVISTVDDEIGGSFSPDGADFYFTRLVPYTTFPRLGILCVSHYAGDHWGAPQALPFSGKNLDYPPRLDSSGSRMFFASSRALPDGTRGGIRIWEVERSAAGWGEPRPLPPPVNPAGSHWSADPSVADDGTLYFSSDRDGPGSIHIYRSRLVDGKYSEPEKLGPAINSEFTEAQPYISPDGKTLIFTSTGSGEPPFKHRPEELVGGGKPYPRADLYISFEKDGKWTQARHLEHGINTVAEEEYPFLSPDGRYFFFSSERSPFTVPTARRLDYRELESELHSTFNGHGNVFFIGVEALEMPK
jgi:dipeptidyl aminopeptidase/acylaminoacyl peptidase